MTMSNTSMKGSERRIQFDVLPERLADFDRLMGLCDLKTRRDLFDNAMSLMEWAVEEALKGRKIASYLSGTDAEILRMPALDHASRKELQSIDVNVAATNDGKQNPGALRPRLIVGQAT